ncbi:kynurenine formamidase [Bradyrhizobium sp. i1.4.4]
MPRKLIDISVPLRNDVTADPPGNHPTIQYIDHQQGLPRMLQFFDGLKAEDLPDGQGWAVEQVSLSTHNGTHLDAPWHFHPTMNRGERSWTIDEVPLEWCLQPGVKLDFRHLPDGYVVTADDVEKELKRIGHTLLPLEIVVVNTSAGAKFGQADYVNSGCGMGYEATMYLLERGVRLTGTDGWSWDAPFVYTAKKYAETKRCRPDLGRSQGGTTHRLLPSREAAQSRQAAVDRIHDLMLPGKDRASVRRVDPSGRHRRQSGLSFTRRRGRSRRGRAAHRYPARRWRRARDEPSCGRPRRAIAC